MSENLYIGLSREQINRLLAGEEVGKRPYDVEASYNDGETRYDDTRIYVKLLSEDDKAKEAGKQVKLCIANGTSQTCHVCGNKQKVTLRERIFRCNQCGNVENRDTNAANVILDRCTVGMTGIEACKSGLSIDIMKQEATLLVEW